MQTSSNAAHAALQLGTWSDGKQEVALEGVGPELFGKGVLMCG